MVSDRKIIISTVAFFAISGLYNYSATGVFLTPFFLINFILSGIALWFAFKYRKTESAYLLWVYAISLIALTSTDQIGINAIASLLHLTPPNYNNWSEFIFILVYLIIAIAWGLIDFKRLKTIGFGVRTILPSLFLIIGISGAFLNLPLLQNYGIALFIVSFHVIVSLGKEEFGEVIENISQQFILFLILQSILYFSMH